MATGSENSLLPLTSGESKNCCPNIILRPRLLDVWNTTRGHLPLGNIDAPEPREVKGHQWLPAADGTRAGEVKFVGTRDPDKKPITNVSTVRLGDMVANEFYNARVEIEGDSEGTDESSAESVKYGVIVKEDHRKVREGILWGSATKGIKVNTQETYYHPYSAISRQDWFKPGMDQPVTDHLTISVQTIEPLSKNDTSQFITPSMYVNGVTVSGCEKPSWAFDSIDELLMRRGLSRGS